MLPAQRTEHALLWRITSPDLPASSYLYGTVHSRDGRVFHANDSLWQVAARMPRLIGELDNDEARGGAMGMMKNMTMPDGRKLKDLYDDPKDLARVEAVLKEELGPAGMMADRLKPFWLMAMLIEEQMPKDSSAVLDDMLQQRARRAGHTVAGLETLQEQLDAVEAIPLKDQAGMLLDLVKHDLYSKDLEKLVKAYASQDLGRVLRMMERTGSTDLVDEQLIVQRNIRMATRMDSLMQQGPPSLFAVGAGHLPGDRGLLKLLQERGYSVLPVAPSRR
ncbi:MAG: TraB/GumN family protein [Flavobacteriales bacterium]|nr:TraB/GumN family protein [Flavobacteriales bacterium]MCB9168656.1 TraB/GumN family protein [Flavobacteriales bacterium]